MVQGPTVQLRAKPDARFVMWSILAYSTLHHTTARPMRRDNYWYWSWCSMHIGAGLFCGFSRSYCTQYDRLLAWYCRLSVCLSV